MDPGSPAPVSGAAATPPPPLRWRRVFPGEERQLSLLRHWLSSLLPECPARDDVMCVATELATNAIRHTASGRGGWFAVEITWHRPNVRVAVADCGAPTGPQLIDDPAADHGRGLVLVRGLSERTGVVGDHRGRLMWADIPWDDGGTESRMSAPDRYEAAIRDGQTDLARRFGGIQAWFGRSTLQWWALAGRSGLVTAATVPELATKLARLPDMPSATPPTETGRRAVMGPAPRDVHREQRPGAAMRRAAPGSRNHPAEGGDSTRPEDRSIPCAARTRSPRPGLPDFLPVAASRM